MQNISLVLCDNSEVELDHSRSLFEDSQIFCTPFYLLLNAEKPFFISMCVALTFTVNLNSMSSFECKKGVKQHFKVSKLPLSLARLTKCVKISKNVSVV